MTLKPGLSCELNLPEAVKGEGLHGLPPYCPIEAFPVDAFPGCPPNWERGSEKDAAYFVEVQNNRGLWLDFNACWNHSHHVAVLLSIQGINPVDGKPAGPPVMEQYREGTVAQNYLATTGTPHGHFWLDGFRGADGEVRQYLFTEETLRGVASQILGDARSFSIGIAFFISKTPKTRPTPHTGRLYGAPKNMEYPFQDLDLTPDKFWENPILYKMSDVKLALDSGVKGAFGSGKMHQSKRMVTNFVVQEIPRGLTPADAGLSESSSEESSVCQDSKTLEIAAGARIRQLIHRDPERLDFWEPDPEGILYIHYVDQKEGSRIRAEGRIGGNNEGSLQGLTVGN